jgi:protein-S-isoprenylcysteine O-methyltransferase Ste14
MLTYWVGCGATGVLFVVTVVLVRMDYQSGEKLSGTTVAVVWAAYLVHSAVTGWFAFAAPVGRLAFDATTAHLVGAFFAGFGTAIALDAIATFASIERMSGLETDELITEGIYRYSRNPQNIGWGLALLGIAVAGRSPAAIALVGLFALVIHGYLVWLEEPHLEKLFGNKYRQYREQTPRYLGRPK